MSVSRLSRVDSWRHHPLRFFALVAVLALALAGASRFSSRLLDSGHGACWIWAQGTYDVGDSIAFYAGREIEVTKTGPARLSIIADESYLLYLNGQRLGAGSYSAGATLDVYDIGERLKVGSNRILVELRSSRGAGGLLARLELGAEDQEVIVTDSSWRIFRRHDAGLFDGKTSFNIGESPKIWARAPTGRWRVRGTRSMSVRSAPATRDASGRPVRHRSFFSPSWNQVDLSRRRIPDLGSAQIYDWGKEVTGYLYLELKSDRGQPALLYFGTSDPPDLDGRPPEAVILPVRGRRYWEDSQPRRFRYVLLVGASTLGWIGLDPLADEALDAVEPRAGKHNGAFGLSSPLSFSKLEERVRSRLEAEAEERRKSAKEPVREE